MLRNQLSAGLLGLSFALSPMLPAAASSLSEGLSRPLLCTSAYGKKPVRIRMNSSAGDLRTVELVSNESKDTLEARCSHEEGEYFCQWGAYSFLKISLVKPIEVFAGLRKRTYFKAELKLHFLGLMKPLLCRFSEETLN